MHALQRRLLHYCEWIAKVHKQLQNYSEYFWILCYVIIFLQKRSCKVWQKITQPKTNQSKNSSDIEACAIMKTDRRENVKFIVTCNLQGQIYIKLQLLIWICFLLDYLLLFLRFLLLALSMCLFAWKDIAQKPLLF